MSHEPSPDVATALPGQHDAGSRKSKVFVSYSRRDRQRIAQLHELLARNKNVTVFRDTDDILPAEEWKPRLEHLIRAADSILFALSPNSAESEECRWEVELAESLNKRIIPVVLEDVKEGAPAALSKLNYIFLTPDHDPDEAIDKISATIDTDIDWVREHTRLAELAERWQHMRNSGAKPLVGRELSEAERWLGSQPRHAPNPTEAHRTFIYESRRAANRRTRRNSVAALFAAVLFAVLAVFSYISYKEANDNFILALLTKADELLAKNMPSKTLVVASAINWRGGLVAQLEALGLYVPNDDQSVRIRTLATLAGPASIRPLKTWKHSSAATSVAFNRSGDLFAVGYTNGEIHIRATERDEPAPQIIRISGRIWNLEFGREDKWLASATSTEVLLWDLEKKTARRFCETGSEITAMAFDPRGRYLAWTLRDGRLVVFDLKTETRAEFDEFQTAPWAAQFSPSGNFFVSSSGDGWVAIRKTTDWSLFRKFKTGRPDLVDISINLDETRLATSSLAGPVDVWNMTADKPEATQVTLGAPDDKRWKLQYSHDGRWLALASWQGTVRFWDADSLQYRGTLDRHDLRVNDIAFSNNGSHFLTAAESGVVRLWDVENIHPMFLTDTGDSRETLVGIYSPDGTRFVSGGKDGTATLFRVDRNGGLQKICHVDHPGWVYSVSFTPDGTRVASVSLVSGSKRQPGSQKIWDGENCELLHALKGFSPSNVELVAYSPTQDLMAWATNAGEIWLTDLNGANQGGHAVQLPQVHTAGIGGIDFSSDGKYLVSGGLDARVIVWDVATRSIYRELKGHNEGEYIWTIQFAPGSHVLASSGTEGRILVWNFDKAAGGELIQTLPLQGGANRLAFNHDGSVLAVGSGNRAVSMWSTGDWHKTFQLNALVGIRSVFDFHPKRGDLAFDGTEGLIRIYLNTHGGEATEPSHDVVLDGMDVYFDRVPNNVDTGANIETIHAPTAACQ